MLTGDRIRALMADIVTAYLSAHAVDAAAVPDLIRSIHQTLETLRACQEISESTAARRMMRDSRNHSMGRSVGG
jgi:predicted transcriptional regulator